VGKQAVRRLGSRKGGGKEEERRKAVDRGEATPHLESFGIHLRFVLVPLRHHLLRPGQVVRPREPQPELQAVAVQVAL
jgi:hypothetical protein